MSEEFKPKTNQPKEVVEALTSPFRPDEPWTLSPDVLEATAWVAHTIKTVMKDQKVSKKKIDDMVEQLAEEFDDRGGQRGPVFAEALQIVEVFGRILHSEGMGA